MAKRLTIEHCHTIAAKHNGKCLSTEYVNSKIKLFWECVKIHQFFMTLNDVVQGHWCSVCAGSQKNTIEDCHILAKSSGGKCISTEYVNAYTKYFWECAKGHRWAAKYNSIYNGHWCPVCGGSQRKTIEDCHLLAEQHAGKCISTEYFNSKAQLFWECEVDHEWSATYNDIQQGKWCPTCAIVKRKCTILKRYGVENLLQNKELAMKQALSSNNSGIILHWATGNRLVWKGSYERKTIEYFNQNKVDFLWQSEVFETPFKTPTNLTKTYRPDLFLVSENKWVEIKGYFRQDAEEKWNWFKSIHSTAELWDKRKLKELGIL
jgi:hypothetical protein